MGPECQKNNFMLIFYVCFSLDIGSLVVYIRTLLALMSLLYLMQKYAANVTENSELVKNLPELPVLREGILGN